MLSQPVAGRLGRPVRQHIDHLTPLEVHHDRPIAAALLPRPVIDPHDPDAVLGAAAGMALEVSQNRIVALGQPEAVQQALCRSPTAGMTHQPRELGNPAGSPSQRRSHLGKRVSKRLPEAAGIEASPPRHLDSERYLGALHGQVLQMADPPAMPAGRVRVAFRTSGCAHPQAGDEPLAVPHFGVQDPHSSRRCPRRD